jgi:hypothetical protein
MFLSAFESEGLEYIHGGAQVAHPELTWSLSLIVDGRGSQAPFRLVLGASLAQLGDLAPGQAEDCYLFLPLGYGDGAEPGAGAPRMPDAAFPDWPGSQAERAAAIGACVAGVVRYARQVDSVRELHARYAAGDYHGAFIIAPLRSLLEEGR